MLLYVASAASGLLSTMWPTNPERASARNDRIETLEQDEGVRSFERRGDARNFSTSL